MSTADPIQSIRSWALSNQVSKNFVSRLEGSERQLLYRVIAGTITACEDDAVTAQLLAKMRRPEKAQAREMMILEIFDRLFRPERSVSSVISLLENFRLGQRPLDLPPKVTDAIRCLVGARVQLGHQGVEELVFQAFDALTENTDAVRPEHRELLIAHLESTARVFSGNKQLSQVLEWAAKLLRVGVLPEHLAKYMDDSQADLRAMLFESRVIDRMIAMNQMMTVDDAGDPQWTAPIELQPITPDRISSAYEELSAGAERRQVLIHMADEDGFMYKDLVDLAKVTDEMVRKHLAYAEIYERFGSIPYVKNLEIDETTCRATLTNLDVSQLKSLGVVSEHGHVQEYQFQYFQEGFVSHSAFNWTELRSYMTLPEGQRPLRPTVEVVTSFETTAGPTALDGHSFVRLIDADGKVYSVGLCASSELGGQATGMRATSQVWLQCPDIHTFMPKTAYQQYVARYELSAEGFDAVRARIMSHQERFLGRAETRPTYQMFSTNCAAFAKDIREAVHVAGGERVELPADYPQLTAFEALCLRVKALFSEVAIQVFSQVVTPLGDKALAALKLSELKGSSEPDAQGSVVEQVRRRSFKTNLPARLVPVKSRLRSSRLTQLHTTAKAA